MCVFSLFVVFDDGDEKTLRRTSLCLKGERHFAESEVSGAVLALPFPLLLFFSLPAVL